jgi:predicted regulator of Ras-like GTPase activity (Roadblock/LC7/MglB family)
MSTPFEGMLAALIRQRGVAGCLVVGEEDGIIVDANVHVGIDAQVVAALAAALYRRARLSSEAAGLATVTFLQLEAEQGSLCAAGREGLVLVTITEPRAPIALIRAAMLQSVGALA